MDVILLMLIAALAVALLITVLLLRDVTTQQLAMRAELYDAETRANRLSWENEILNIERRAISIEYNIKMLPLRSPRRRNQHG